MAEPVKARCARDCPYRENDAVQTGRWPLAINFSYHSQVAPTGPKKCGRFKCDWGRERGVAFDVLDVRVHRGEGRALLRLGLGNLRIYSRI